MKRKGMLFISLAWLAMLQAASPSSDRDIEVSTYLGGCNSETCCAVILESDGTVLLAGTTQSPDYPVTKGACCEHAMGGGDLFLTRLDHGLTRVIASTLLGGSGRDQCKAMTLDPSGQIVVAGNTGSADFPMVKGAYACSTRGKGDCFVLKIDPSLKKITASVVLGGGGLESCQGLAVDRSGNIYLSGTTRSLDFPVTPKAFDTTLNSGRFKGDHQGNIFITKLDNNLTTLLASTYLGGTGGEVMGRIALDREGNVFVTGSTRSTDFPVTDDAFDSSFNSPGDSIAGDAFVTKLDPDLGKVLASTYLGGPGMDWGYHLALDQGGNVYITGHVDRDFPVTREAYDTTFNDPAQRFFGSDAYVAKLDNSLSALLASTYLGGPGEDIGTMVLPDPEGGVYLAGVTRAAGYPTTSGALQPRFHPGNGQYEGDLFLSKLTTDLKTLSASTLFGGSGNEMGAQCLALRKKGGLVVAGATCSPELKMPKTACDPTFDGQSDLYVLNLDSLTTAGSEKAALYRLTQDAAWDYHPHWSLDGKTVSFTSQRSGEAALWTIPAAGGEASRIPLDLTGDLYNEWSPNGSEIVFDAYSKDTSLDIFLYSFTTGRTRQITSFRGFDGAPSLSPDGAHVAFVSMRSGNQDIWTMPVEGGEPRRITFHQADDWHPRWSPDGKKILYTSNRSGNPDIWISAARGGSPSQITRHEGNDDRACWSPDSSMVAVTSDRSGNHEIWIIPVDGGEAVRITDHPLKDGMPCWSPDGTRIAFCSHRSGNLDIWVIKLPARIVESMRL